MSNELIKDGHLKSLFGIPPTPGAYFDDFLKRKNVTPNKAAKEMGLAQSTVQRFINGGSLSVNMAKAIQETYKIDCGVLFKIDAKYKTFLVSEMG